MLILPYRYQSRAALVPSGGGGGAIATLADTLTVTGEANPARWIDATDLSTITKDGSDQVTQWNDKGSAGANFTASGGDVPLYQLASPNLNNKPAIGRASDHMTSSLMTWGLIDRLRSNNNINNLRARLTGDGANRDTGAVVPTGKAVLIALIYNTSGGAWWINGTSVATWSFAHASAGALFALVRVISAGSGTTFGMLIGDNGGSGVGGLFATGAGGTDGDFELHQMAYYAYEPAAATRQFAEGVLAWSGGTQADLVGGHPHAGAAPTT
jgi:hypothetical protein